MGLLHTYLSDFFKKVTRDEQLIRLVHYKPSSGLDDPLSPTKPNLFGTTTYYNVISKKNFIRAPKATDLTEGGGICRICMYIGSSSRTGNMKVYNQEIVFDVLVHIVDFEEKDSRSLRIIDRLTDLLQEEHITGVGKVVAARTSVPIGAPEGYIAYRNTFTFGATK